MNKKVIITALILISVIAAGLYLYLNNGSIPVKQISLKSEIVKKTVSASGSVKSSNEADLSFVSGGKISKVYVNKNDTVYKGQLLASLDSSSVYQNSKALKDARDIAIRNKDLYIEQNSDNEDIDEGEYQIKIRTLNEQISQAQASYNAALTGYTNLNIKAPFPGTILDISKKEGEAAVPGEMFIKIADLNDLYFEIELDQEDFGNIEKAQKVEIALDSYPDPLQGEIFDYSNYAESDVGGNKIFKVKIKFIDPQVKLYLGMTGDVDIIIANTTTSVSAIDYDLIYYEDNTKPYVWYYSNGTVNKLYLELGLEGDLTYEVKNPDINDYILISPVNEAILLNDGQKAKITK